MFGGNGPQHLAGRPAAAESRNSTLAGGRERVEVMEKQEQAAAASVPTSTKNYKGFVGGVFSGISKLSGKLLWHAVTSTVH